MIAYLDASAVVKRYVREPGSAEVQALIESSEVLGTVLLSRTEVVAAFAKAERMGALDRKTALAVRSRFEDEWEDLVRLALHESHVARAADLAWSHGLRGYDALHLAAASSWGDLLGQPPVFATFDRRLWVAAGEERMRPWPDGLPQLLASWKS